MTAYWLGAALISLGAFAMVATVTSVLMGLAAPALLRRVDRYSASSRAALLFKLRVLPAACATVCALGVALPVFLWFEPRDTDETFGRTLFAAAAAGAWLLGRGAWRAAAAAADSPLILTDRRDIVPGTSNQWLLRYRRSA